MIFFHILYTFIHTYNTFIQSNYNHQGTLFDNFALMIHIGQKIKEVVEKRGIAKTELARRLNMTSSNIHKIFNRESIDTDLLTRLSEILEFDFFQFYQQTPSNLKQNANTKEKPASYTSHPNEEAEYYKTKLLERDEEVIRLQKRIIELLERIVKPE